MKPELGQRRENDSEISATVRGKQSGYVLDEDKPPGANKLVCDSGELEEESRSSPLEAASSASDAEILAGESSDDAVDEFDIPAPAIGVGGMGVGAIAGEFGAGLLERALTLESGLFGELLLGVLNGILSPEELNVGSGAGDASHVGEAGDVGPVLGEDSPPPLVPLALEDDAHARPLEAEIESSHPAEERGDP